MTGHDLVSFFKTQYPENNAYEWDHVGLQVGRLNQKINGILIALDVTEAVIEEAIQNNCNTIISHHPFLFHPLKKINLDTPKGALIEKIIKHQLMIYSAHTNYDVGHPGMNQMLADKIGLSETEVLDVDENGIGMGRIGTIAPRSLDDFIDHVKNHLDLKHVYLISHHDDKIIQKVAISGGSGSSHMMAAKKKNADIYLTGDVTYHTALECLELKLRVLDIGHYAESHFKTALKEELIAFGIKGPIVTATVEVSPFKLK
jgi:dinuclear metal center YbgI/SA1388 family protein